MVWPSVAEDGALPGRDREDVSPRQLAEFLDGLVSHYVLDDGKLVVAHAGMKAEMQGRGSGKVREFALYGETTGETDEFGLPVRYNWAAEYRGRAMVVYGHTPGPRTRVAQSHDQHRHRLRLRRQADRPSLARSGSSFRSPPPGPTVSRPGRSCRPKTSPTALGQQVHDDLLDAEDVLGKRIISTRLRANVTIREENAMAALEVMSRFAANPKWLIYLPPTMSPCETSDQDGFLEHPDRGVRLLSHEGVAQVVCEEKHMGSRAVVIVCRGRGGGHGAVRRCRRRAGIVYTRTGRRFFNDPQLEAEFLDRVRAAMDRQRLLDAVRHRLGLPRLRVDALVGQGPGTSPLPIRGRRRGWPGGVAEGRGGPATGVRASGRRGRSGQSSYSSDIDGLLRRHENRAKRSGSSSLPTGNTAGRSNRSTT